MRNSFVEELTRIVEADSRVVLMTGDLGFGVLDDFAKRFPSNFINAGIAEQNMMSVAAGMALSGKIIYVYSIANFPTLRCIEQIRNLVAYFRANVKIVSLGAGVGYGALGMTHHNTEDLSVVRAIPNITILSPSDPYEAALSTKYAYKTPGTFFIRLGKGGETMLTEQSDGLEERNFQKPREIFHGADESTICVFSTGAISPEALKNAKLLGAPLYVFPVVKPIDTDFITNAATQYDTIICFEENNIIGGFGGAVAEVVSSIPGKRACVKRIGFPDTFTCVGGDISCLINMA